MADVKIFSLDTGYFLSHSAVLKLVFPILDGVHFDALIIDEASKQELCALLHMAVYG